MSDKLHIHPEEIALSLKEGDRTAFEFLFARHYAALVGYITTFTQNQQQSEDIVQHSFIVLWEKRDRLSEDVSPKNYLYTIAYNRYLDLYRKSVRKIRFLEELRAENLRKRIKENPEILEGRTAKLKKLIDRLPPRCKEILYLSRQRGLEYTEIAQQLGISPRSVEEQIRIAFKKIRSGFKEDVLICFVLALRYIL